MIENQSAVVSIEEIRVQTISHLFKSLLPDECKKIVCDVFEKADTSFNDEKQNDNLLKTDRTGWVVHEEHQELHPVLDVIFNTLNNAFQQIAMAENFAFGVELNDSWIARSKAGAVVDPHHHGLVPCRWSFCFYAKIPSGKSSITFMDNNLSQKVVIHVQEGDLIWFPSYLTHYSVDTEDGRLIYSGNSHIITGQPIAIEEEPPSQEQLDEQKVY